MFATVTAKTTAAQFEQFKTTTGKRVVCRPFRGGQKPSVCSSINSVSTAEPAKNELDVDAMLLELEQIHADLCKPLCAADFESETGQPLVNSYADIRG